MFHTAQRVLAGLCVAVSMVFIAMPTVKAQSPDGGFEAKLVVVDLGEILRKAEATKKVRALLDEKRDEFQREFSQKEREMLSREKELKSSNLSCRQNPIVSRLHNFRLMLLKSRNRFRPDASHSIMPFSLSRTR